MTGVPIKRENLDTEMHIEVDNVKRCRENTAIYKPRRESWNRPFSHSPQMEPRLLPP